MTRDAAEEHCGGALVLAIWDAIFLWERGIAKSSEGAVPAAPATLKLASESPDFHSDAGANATGSGAGAGSGAKAAEDSSQGAANSGLLTNVKRCISVDPFRDVSEAAHAGVPHCAAAA